MKKTIKTPFTIERCNQIKETTGNYPHVIIRDGSKARIIATDSTESDNPIVALVSHRLHNYEERVYTFTNNGEFAIDSPNYYSCYDLFIIEEVDCWHNSDVPKGYYRPEKFTRYYIPTSFKNGIGLYYCTWMSYHNDQCDNKLHKMGLSYATPEEADAAARVIFEIEGE